MTDTLYVSTFAAVNRPNATTYEVTWVDLVKVLTTHAQVEQKTDVGLFNFCRFSTPYRSNAHVIDVSALLLDVDDESLETVQALAAKLAPYAHAGHSTFKHGIEPDRFRLRLAVRLDRPVLREEWASFAHGVRSWLGAGLDRCLVIPSQSYYLPACHPTRDKEKLAFAHEGAPLCVQAILAAAPWVEEEKESTPAEWRPELIVGLSELRALPGELAARVAAGGEIAPKGQRHWARRDLVFQFLCEYGPCEPDAELLQVLTQSAEAPRERWVAEFTSGSARAKAEAKHAENEIAKAQAAQSDAGIRAALEAQRKQAAANVIAAQALATAASGVSFSREELKTLALRATKHDASVGALLKLAAKGASLEHDHVGAIPKAGQWLGRQKPATDPALIAKQFEQSFSAAEHLELLKQSITQGQQAVRLREPWRKACSMSDEKIAPHEKNIRVLLLQHEDLQEKLYYNVRSDFICAAGVPWTRGKEAEWSATDSGGAMEWASNVIGSPVSSAQVDAALEGVKKALPTFDPVQVYFARLPPWDGVPRLSTWLHTYAGAPDDSYTRQVARATLIAAARRTLSPGCQADQVAVLEGAQGAKKTSLLRALCPSEDLFLTAEGALSLDNVRLIHKVQGAWIVELGELSGLKRSDTDAAKAFLSERVDVYRAPYGRHNLRRPRRVIFIGSVNRRDYLTDTTGNRRWLPVETSACHPEKLAQDRDQLWAEVLAAEAAGEAHWVEASDEVRAIQASRTTEDAITPQVIECAEFFGEVCYEQIFEYLGVPSERRNSLRVRSILESNGWVQGRQKRLRAGLPFAGLLSSGRTKDFNTQFWTNSVATAKEVP